jgi:hypothetical protein
VNQNLKVVERFHILDRNAARGRRVRDSLDEALRDGGDSAHRRASPRLHRLSARTHPERSRNTMSTTMSKTVDLFEFNGSTYRVARHKDFFISCGKESLGLPDALSRWSSITNEQVDAVKQVLDIDGYKLKCSVLPGADASLVKIHEHGFGQIFDSNLSCVGFVVWLRVLGPSTQNEVWVLTRAT